VNFLDRFSNGLTGSHDEAKNSFWQFFKRAKGKYDACYQLLPNTRIATGVKGRIWH